MPGTFTYTPAAGTILDAGSDPTLAVTFTPENSTDYTTATASTTIAVTRATPVIKVTAALASIAYGETVSLLATVGTPGGTITFYDGTALLATVPVDGTGMATLTTSDLSVGSHSITAAYSGDADYIGVRSASTTETVAPTSTQMVLAQTPVYKKKKLTSVSLTVDLTVHQPASAIPRAR